jgi:hypothetical protein
MDLERGGLVVVRRIMVLRSFIGRRLTRRSLVFLIRDLVQRSRARRRGGR